MNKAQEKFANEMIRHGNTVKAYRKAYPSCKSDQAAKVNANRLLKNATIQLKIKQGGEIVSNLAQEEAVNEAKDEFKGTLLTSLQKRSILAEIANGDARIQERLIKYNSKGDPEIEFYYREPNAMEKIKAIDIENKMTGDNAAIRQDLTSKGESLNNALIEQKRFDQLLKAAREGIGKNKGK